MNPPGVAVQTPKLFKAQELLHNNKVLLITGEPGIGKTTLSEMLCLGYVGQGFEFIYADDVDEAESVFDKETSQVFLLDDFLGSNYLEFIEGKAESKIIRFVDRVKANKNKRLILSSRTTIFNNALLRGIHLSDMRLEDLGCVLELEDYSYLERARLLYNHLCFRDLDITYLERIKEGKQYLKIVKHKHFNPRVIEFITSSDKIEGRVGDEYLDFVLGSLDNPASIWGPAYINQIGAEAKLLVQTLFTFGGDAFEVTVKEAFDSRLCVETEKSNLVISESPFNSAVKVLLDGFITRQIIEIKGRKYVKLLFINPSIADFMCTYLAKNDRPFSHMIESIVFVEQMGRLLKANVNSDAIIKSQRFKYLFESPLSFKSQISNNINAATLVLIRDNNLYVNQGTLLEMLHGAMGEKMNEKEFAVALAILENAVVGDNWPKKGNIEIYAKRLLLDSKDLSDVDSTLKVLKKYDFDGVGLINGCNIDADVAHNFQRIVESEAEKIMNDDSDFNSARDPWDVSRCLTRLEDELKSNILDVGINYCRAIETFDSVDASEVAESNINSCKDEDADEGYYSGGDSTTGITDNDIESVFKN